MKILQNITNDKKDLVKASNAVNTVQDLVGESVTINGILIFEKEELDEKSQEVVVQRVSAFRLTNGEFYTSISPTVKSSLESIIEVFDADEIKAGIEIQVKSRTSKGGRDFIYIDL